MKLLDENVHDFIKDKVDAVLQHALSNTTDMGKKSRTIPEQYWPDAVSLKRGVKGSGDAFKDMVFKEREDFNSFSNLTFVNVISRVAARNMEKDKRIVYLGEEVGNLGGGAYNATKYVVQKFSCKHRVYSGCLLLR